MLTKWPILRCAVYKSTHAVDVAYVDTARIRLTHEHDVKLKALQWRNVVVMVTDQPICMMRCECNVDVVNLTLGVMMCKTGLSNRTFVT